ncbi:unnamed protein product [Phytophthora fragariaefolia]|uniref:Unnamed protein product n=1 Tax=Phytophthora fragariaefolia TaxID=1490495 RepID=A0A9W6TYX6_9STRA|nr:unnamed protein product [Phytophthora fragariaefolia]
MIVVTISMYLSDLRCLRMIIEWLGFHHVIFIDAHVLGLRNLTCILIFGIFSIVTVLVWIMLGRVDGGASFTVLKYESKRGGFELSGLDVIGNGLVSLSLLLAKIIFRRRKTLRTRRKRSSSLVECVIYRCRLKLDVVQEPGVPKSWDSRYSSKYSSKEASPRKAEHVQHLIFVKFSQKFDATNTLLPWELIKRVMSLPGLIKALYGVGLVGLISSHGSLFYEFSDSVDDTMHKRLELMVSYLSLLCTLSFTASFAVFYQRQLLNLLFHSFDFVFYSFQVTSSYMCVCSLYSWELPQCLMAISLWLWAHWVFTIDALTPIMKNMLKFRAQYAAPVLGLLLIDHVGWIYQVLMAGDTQLQDSIIFEGTIWAQHLCIRVVPFYVSRSLTLVLWCSRLVARLSLASDNDVTILRGSVCYDNFFANESRTSSQLSQVVEVKALESLPRHARVSPSMSFHQG